MRRWFLALGLLVVVAVVTALSGCTFTPAPTGAIEGTIYYYSDGTSARHIAQLKGISTADMEPLGSASVVAETPYGTVHTTTNPSGWFHLSSVPVGTATVTVTHPDFRDSISGPVDVYADETTTLYNQTMPVGHFVGVGINTYMHVSPNLSFAVADADAIYDRIFAQFKGTTARLENTAATRAAIVSRIAQERDRMGDGDYFVLYFSGHGEPNAVLPTDYVLNNSGTSITDTDLRALVNGFPDPSRVVIILDTCYSGSFFDGKALTPDPPAIPKALKGSPCTVIAASRAAEESSEGGGIDHGWFTSGLIEAVTNVDSLGRLVGDYNHDRKVTVSEAFAYAKAYVQGLTDGQTPVMQAGTSDPVLAAY